MCLCDSPAFAQIKSPIWSLTINEGVNLTKEVHDDGNHLANNYSPKYFINLKSKLIDGLIRSDTIVQKWVLAPSEKWKAKYAMKIH